MVKDLILISKYAGMREDLAQAGGGNSSVKLDEERMLIKASGVQLADVTETEGFSVVDYPMITDFMEKLVVGENTVSANEILEKALIEGKRPSIETFLHAITGKVTLHTHSLPVNILTASNEGMDRLRSLFPEALFVEYATPGAHLAQKYFEAYLKKSNGTKVVYPVIFLQNHGLIVSGDTAGEVIQMTDEVNEAVEKEIAVDCSAYRKAFEIFQTFEKSSLTKGKVIVKAENEKLLQCFRKFGYKVWDYQFCPDCVVFGGMKPYDFQVSSKACDIDAFACKYGEPVIVTYGEDLYIRADSVRKAREIESVLAFSGQVALTTTRLQGLNLLSEKEQKFLLNWDAEKYRNQMK
ncbi:MAG: class II aldolase/adducin family protein [Eubacterium sp.]|nr:class II aldolase/adducin family protein [Eubacterium sp.]